MKNQIDILGHFSIQAEIDCALLLRISRVMQFNFFRYYAAEVAKGMQERLGEE